MTERKIESTHQPAQSINEAMDMLKINKELDRRVMNSMRADNIKSGAKNVFYSKGINGSE